MFCKPELALPAGSLQCALYAFKGGADAVYLGMKNFSARKGAVNFSFEDLRKLKKICLEQGKKFYITLNTLVSDSDIPVVIQQLKQLDFLKPDGIIIQDLGIAKLIRDYFPKLEMHASTQLAVHTVNGVRELQHLGFTRVVLSRELSYEEIKHIREACPDIELKVFIHGALCYGFSGLCMASQQITGRSANCGACAQICRTWFNCKETSENGWFFSMNDLELGKAVCEYSKIGIDSLKIEGRMKGPEYVYWTAKYYRLLLDGKDENDNDVQWAKEAMETSFSRKTTQGFFNTKKSGCCNADNMICSDFSSHRGIKVGYIQKILNGKAQVVFEKPVSIRDGLLVISNGESSGFALSYTGSSRSFISAGETEIINFPTSDFKKKPEYGTPVMCTSRHNQNLPLLNENIGLYKKPVDIEIIIKDGHLIINGQSFEIDMQEASKPQNLDSLFEQVFTASDKSLFTSGNIRYSNNSSFENPFIPLSLLKNIRRAFYANLDIEFEKSLNESMTIPEINIPETVADIVLDAVTFNEEEYLNSLKPEKGHVYGLNNIGQVIWAKEHPDINVSADAFLYTHNNLAYQLLKEELPNLVGSCSEEKRVLPMFISRVCFRHNALGLPCSGCTKDNTYHISQNGRTYKVECKNCITTVTETDLNR